VSVWLEPEPKNCRRSTKSTHHFRSAEEELENNGFKRSPKVDHITSPSSSVTRENSDSSDDKVDVRRLAQPEKLFKEPNFDDDSEDQPQDGPGSTMLPPDSLSLADRDLLFQSSDNVAAASSRAKQVVEEDAPTNRAPVDIGPATKETVSADRDPAEEEEEEEGAGTDTAPRDTGGVDLDDGDEEDDPGNGQALLKRIAEQLEALDGPDSGQEAMTDDDFDDVNPETLVHRLTQLVALSKRGKRAASVSTGGARRPSHDG
jgi:hypothetical protein